MFAKGTAKIIHEVVLLRAEVTDHRKANSELSRRRRAKRTRIQEGGSLNIQDIEALRDQEDIERQIFEEEDKSKRKRRQIETNEQRC